MSIEKPLIHLPLDEIKDGKLTNLGTLKTIKFTPNEKQKIALDSKIGTCLIFEKGQGQAVGGKLGTINIKKGFTISLWVRYDSFGNYGSLVDINVINDDDRKGKSYRIFISNDREKNNFILGVGSEEFRILNFFKEGVWQHLVCSIDEKGATHVYLDGGLKKTHALRSEFTAKGNYEWDLFMLGQTSLWKGKTEIAQTFHGALGQFRFYNRPLSKAEAMALYRKDAHAFAAYRATMPLEVQLNTFKEDDYFPILYVEGEDQGAPLDLILTNPGNKKIEFKEFDTPSESNYHFQLRFRRHVASDHLLNTLRKADSKVMNGWKYALCNAAHSGKEDWISFVWDGDTDTEGTIAPGDLKTIRIDGFSASGEGGPRNTRVEVRYQLKGYEMGSVLRHLEIQNHSGLKTIPLMAEVRGSSTFINGGKKDNEFTILLEYTKETGSLNIPNGAKFVLAWEEPELVEKGSINVASTDKSLENIEKKGDSYVFEVKKDIVLEKGKSIEIDVSKWKTNITSGRHHFLLRYYGIPGFWDGVWPIPVDVGILSQRPIKTPAAKIAPPEAATEGLGIGTDEPTERLHVEGNALVHGKLLIGEPFRAEKAKTAFEAKDKGAYKNDAAIIFASDYGQEDHAWIRFHSRSTNAHNLEIQVDKQGADHLVLQPATGNVGIGIDDPSTKLHVKGGTKLEGAVDITGIVTIGGVEIEGIELNDVGGNTKHSSFKIKKGIWVGSDYSKDNTGDEDKEIVGLLKFCADGDFQFLTIPAVKTHFKKPVLALHTGDGESLGFYGHGSTPLLEVEGLTGNTFIKGNTVIGATASTKTLTVHGTTTLNGDVHIGAAGAGKHGNLHVKGYIEMEEAFFKVAVEDISLQVHNPNTIIESLNNKIKLVEQKLGENKEGEVCMFMIKQLPKMLLFAWKSGTGFHYAHLKHDTHDSLVELMKAALGQH